jgi:pentatricopeptide repeat protein
MDANNILGDTVFYISALSVCNLENGILIHKHAEKKNFNSIEVTTALVSMYTKFKYFSPIQKLYDKDQLDPSNESGEIFYLTLLSACAKGKLVTLGNTVALSLKDKNLGARLYNALIYMHTQNLQLQEAQDIYHEMKKKRIACDSHSIVSLLTACADIGPAAMDFGKSIYNDVRVEHEFVLNSLINMFGKCGDPDEARRVFDQWRDSTTVSVVTWTALIGAYGNVGRIEEALETFNTMLSQGVTPNVNTIGVLLNACAHSGSINEAEQLIARLDTWNIKLNEYHRTCLVDVYARAGRLQEAEDLLANSPPNIISLTSLLGACRSTGDVERAERIFSKLIKLDSTQAHAYVLMANIYAKAGDTENRNKIWKLMHKNNVKKIPGISQVFVNNKLYSFKSEDVDHPQWREIYKYYDTLNDEMVEAGFEPDTSYVTRNDVLSEEDKKQVLCRHSEKIGIAFALMSTLEGTPIKVSKNLRVCGDCHTATKFIAKLKQRRIIVRDARRTHVFSKDGTCSCGDYW